MELEYEVKSHPQLTVINIVLRENLLLSSSDLPRLLARDQKGLQTLRKW